MSPPSAHSCPPLIIGEPMSIRHVVAVLIALSPRLAAAHCDTTRGPVVAAARAALEAGDVELVLHWVRPQDEAAVRAAFQEVMAVRRLSPEARALADRTFFETLVRIHRAGEGAPYTGLSDSEPEPIIAATDRALDAGSSDELEEELVSAVEDGVRERFAAARAARSFRPGDVAAGRRYVGAYVSLTHWVEGVASAAARPAEHHAPAAHHDQSAAPPGERSAPATRRYLPWTLAALLAIAALIEGLLLVRRRRAVIAGR